MAHTHRPPTDSARIPGLVALLVLLVCALTAGTAAAASPSTAASPPDGSSVVGTPSASAASSTPAAAPAPSGLIVSSTPSGPVAAPARPAPPAAHGQPTIIAPNSGDAAVGRPSRAAARPPASQVTVDSSVVATVSPPPLKAGVVQLNSAGPLVDSATGRPPAAGVNRRPPVVAAMLRGLPLFTVAPAPARTVSVSVAMEGVYLTGSTSAHRPGQRPAPAVAGPPVGPAGLGSVSLGSPWGPSSPVPGGSAWLGNAPVSSSGASGVSLLGLTAVLAAMTLLAGVSGRRRPWVWPELAFRSLLCSAVLDRPG